MKSENRTGMVARRLDHEKRPGTTRTEMQAPSVGRERTAKECERSLSVRWKRERREVVVVDGGRRRSEQGCTLLAVRRLLVWQQRR